MALEPAKLPSLKDKIYGTGLQKLKTKVVKKVGKVYKSKKK
jgi:hypothetical protein